MPPAGFEPTILAGDRLQTHALDRSATRIGWPRNLILRNPEIQHQNSHTGSSDPYPTLSNTAPTYTAQLNASLYPITPSTCLHR